MPTTFTYDLGSPRKLVSGGSYRTTFAYDPGPPVKPVDPSGCRTNLTYDNSGLPVRKLGEEPESDKPTVVNAPPSPTE